VLPLFAHADFVYREMHISSFFSAHLRVAANAAHISKRIPFDAECEHVELHKAFHFMPLKYMYADIAVRPGQCWRLLK